MRFIVHVDMDAFFAAIEQRDNKDLRGRPVIIGADPKAGKGRGVVATCSYEARRFGVRSAMPISKAYRCCPQAVYLPADIKKYLLTSEKIKVVLDSFTPLVEMVSIDEAYLDISASCHILGGPFATCAAIKKAVKAATGLSLSLGLAPNKLAAKIASDLKKPDGFVAVSEGQLIDFLKPLPIEKIGGIGKRTTAIFQAQGINTIGELAAMDPLAASELLGKNGLYFLELAKGIDKRSVSDHPAAKSIGKEITFENDLTDPAVILTYLLSISENISARLRRQRKKTARVTIKIRSKNFNTRYFSKTLNIATNFSDTLYKIAKQLFIDCCRADQGIRLVGLKASDLMDSDKKCTLFDAEPRVARQERIHRALDHLNEKFGNSTVYRGRIGLCRPEVSSDIDFR